MAVIVRLLTYVGFVAQLMVAIGECGLASQIDGKGSVLHPCPPESRHSCGDFWSECGDGTGVVF
jgi:hypothetical protein